MDAASGRLHYSGGLPSVAPTEVDPIMVDGKVIPDQDHFANNPKSGP